MVNLAKKDGGRRFFNMDIPDLPDAFLFLPMHLPRIVLALIFLLPFHALRAAESASKPNIIIILADDLGYGDLGCYGHPSIRTPELDRMAREGMRFTDFYAAAEVCTPSRAALLTGRYPVRSGMSHDKFRVLRNISTGHLPESEVTLAELLKGQGYATACIGKWHLGVWANNPAGHPGRHGFDVTFGLPHSNDMNALPGTPREQHNSTDPDPKWWNSPLYDGDKIIEQPADQTTLTRRYTERAVRFIRERKDEPFFLYFPHSFPHTPIFASEQFRGKSPRGRYGDVVEEIDWSVGQILAAVRETGIERNTFVFFTSDNGPWLIRGLAGGSSGPLRDGKGSTWEGGMRVPGIAWMPGRIPSGSTCRDLATTMDLFTTCATWAGAKAPTDRPIDGTDITPLLTGTGTVQRDVFCYYRGTRLFAARMGKWKAHFMTQTGYGAPTPVVHEPPQLFDLQADPGESFNVAEQNPAVLDQIKAAVERHKATCTPAPAQLEATMPQSLTQQASPSALPQPKKPSTAAVSKPAPTLADVAYGTHPKQVLHFWQAESSTPTPLLFFIHGGGWQSGDRMSGLVNLLPEMLQAGISVVSVEYRFIVEAMSEGIEPPVKAPLHDAARALQFVRSKAAEWNIDPQRVAAAGGSAGACSSLWLAFHDDLADPQSSDPVARQSTRLQFAAVTGAQTTLDPQQMHEWTPNSRYGGHAFGFMNPTDPKSRDTQFARFLAERERVLPWIREFSPFEHVSAGDTPVWLSYSAPPALGEPAKDPTHTANFGVKLQEHCRTRGVACELVYPGASVVKHADQAAAIIAALGAEKR